jgi:hypothetical protein
VVGDPLLQVWPASCYGVPSAAARADAALWLCICSLYGMSDCLVWRRGPPAVEGGTQEGGLGNAVMTYVLLVV